MSTSRPFETRGPEAAGRAAARAAARYPEALRQAEATEVTARRTVTGMAQDAPWVGLALSGGGIRSATFCSGVVTELARLHLLRRFDLLSTVSGGGYYGGFLGALFCRKGVDPDVAERELADPNSWSSRWLRENGCFLSPNGARDNWQAAAVFVRNWSAINIVMLVCLLFLLVCGAALRSTLDFNDPPWLSWSLLERQLHTHWVLGLWWSPWLLLALLPFALLMFPAGTLYWFTQFPGLVEVCRRISGLFHGPFRRMSEKDFERGLQLLLTRMLSFGFTGTVLLFGFALVDSLSQTAYHHWVADHYSFPKAFSAIIAFATVLYGVGDKVWMLLEPLFAGRCMRLPMNLAALLGALAWLLVITVGLGVAAYALVGAPNEAMPNNSLFVFIHAMPLWWIVLALLFICWWFSRCFGFVNLSSMQQVYAARLSRAYVGASNPGRRDSRNFSMTELVPGDDISLEAYRPQDQGGPLHFINVTINETISGRSQIDRRDRKGLAMALGPCGLSVGTDAHSLWLRATEHSGKKSLFRTTDPYRRTRPLEEETRSGFHALGAHGLRFLPSRSSVAGERRVEGLSLGRWVAVSGAAFTTGLGSGTQVGLSLLLGLANIRLGYWWDSGLEPQYQHGRLRYSPVALFSRALSWALPVQCCLANEFLARFHGPARRHWYLSDGGHFENSACYELIRRRLGLIICVDAGQDPSYRFGDLANLVRKARADFDAEIEFLSHAPASGEKDVQRCPDAPPFLEEILHPAQLAHIGALTDFGPPARGHALLARIRYLDTQATGWLLVIKPSLTGDESLDVGEYARAHPSFPQEPTTDQYFDEAQWESYHRLGRHIAARLFAPPPAEGRGWSPGQFQAPA